MATVPNPYAPPSAPVADIQGDGGVRPQPLALVAASAFAYIIGGILTFLAAIAIISAINKHTFVWTILILPAYGFASMAGGAAIRRRARRPVIVWCVLCGLILALPLLARAKLDPTAVSLIVIFSLQFLAALTAVFVIKAKKETPIDERLDGGVAPDAR